MYTLTLLVLDCMFIYLPHVPDILWFERINELELKLYKQKINPYTCIMEVEISRLLYINK